MVPFSIHVNRGNTEIDHFDLAWWVLYSKIVWFDILVNHPCLCMQGLNGVKHLQKDADYTKLLLASLFPRLYIFYDALADIFRFDHRSSIFKIRLFKKLRYKLIKTSYLREIKVSFALCIEAHDRIDIIQSSHL